MTTSAELTQEGTSKFAQAGNIKVHYNEAGTGPVVVMLHGGGAGASGFSNFWRNFGPVADAGYRVLLVDQLGYGQTGHWDGVANNSENNARMLRDLFDTIGVDKASFVGNSMGGSTALNFAIDYPDRVEKVVQMGSAVAAFESLFVPIQTEGQKALFAAARNPSVETLGHFFSLMVYDSSFVTEELLQTRVKTALANMRPAHFAPGEPMKRNLLHELDRCKAPTLIIWGRDDRVAALDGSLRMLWGLPEAQLHVFSQCGHWAQYEHADAFNRLVIDFLSH